MSRNDHWSCWKTRPQPSSQQKDQLRRCWRRSLADAHLLASVGKIPPPPRTEAPHTKSGRGGAADPRTKPRDQRKWTHHAARAASTVDPTGSPPPRDTSALAAENSRLRRALAAATREADRRGRLFALTSDKIRLLEMKIRVLRQAGVEGPARRGGLEQKLGHHVGGLGKLRRENLEAASLMAQVLGEMTLGWFGGLAPPDPAAEGAAADEFFEEFVVVPEE